MGLSVGIVGLPNVGKSTLFNALVRQEVAKVDSHPFTTIKPNVGVIGIPDERLDKLVEMVEKEKNVKKVPATVRFVDIAGLVKGAAQGAGLGNQFLGHIREVDLILHVLRKFENLQVAHVTAEIDPANDAKTVELELILADFEVVNKVLKKKRKDKEEVEVLKKVEEVLRQGKPAAAALLTTEEKKIIQSFNFLTLKPEVLVLNISENQLAKGDFSKQIGKEKVIPICAKLELEILELASKEQKEYLKSLGIKKTALPALLKTIYKTLDLITFYTVKGAKQVTAWPVRKGMTALEAAGIIHSDFAKRFVKAEVIEWAKLLKAGSWAQAGKKGWLALQGKDYKVKDGDVIEFKLSL